MADDKIARLRTVAPSLERMRSNFQRLAIAFGQASETMTAITAAARIAEAARLRDIQGNK